VGKVEGDRREAETGLAPLVVAVVTPGVFIVLITLLSSRGAGASRTSLTSDPSHVQAVYMLGSSILLTTSFIGREALLLRLERVQVGTEGLEALIESCLSKMKDVQELLDRVSRRVPSMNLSGERQSLSEYSSYLTDVKRQFERRDRGADLAVPIAARVHSPPTLVEDARGPKAEGGR